MKFFRSFLSMFRKPVKPDKKLPAFMQRHIAAQDAGVFGYHD